MKLPAEAEAYRVQTVAEGRRTETLEVARAEAERIRKIGQAESEAIAAVGKSQAETMKAKASSYANFGNAGVSWIQLRNNFYFILEFSDISHTYLFIRSVL